MLDVDCVEWLQHLVTWLSCLSFRQLVKVLGEEALEIYAIAENLVAVAVEFVDAAPAAIEMGANKNAEKIHSFFEIIFRLVVNGRNFEMTLLRLSSFQSV